MIEKTLEITGFDLNNSFNIIYVSNTAPGPSSLYLLEALKKPFDLESHVKFSVKELMLRVLAKSFLIRILTVVLSKGLIDTS